MDRAEGLRYASGLVGDFMFVWGIYVRARACASALAWHVICVFEKAPSLPHLLNGEERSVPRRRVPPSVEPDEVAERGLEDE